MARLTEVHVATDPSPLQSLHCNWGGDYLIAEKAHFGAEAEPPWYFAPFDGQIAEIWETMPQDGFLLRRPDPAMVALETERFTLLRLSGLCAE